MKKVSRERRLYLKRVNLRRFRRRLVSAQKSGKSRGGKLRGQRRVRRAVPLHVTAPKVFLLEAATPRRELMTMLDAIRKAVYGRRPVKIDFSKTQKMFPCGTLLFQAEIDRLIRQAGRKLVRANYPPRQVLEQLLQQVGILEMLGLRERAAPGTFPDNVKYWRRASGEMADGQVLAPIVTPYEGVLPTSGLYAGVVEAMTNSVQHAYDEGASAAGRPGGFLNCKKWWVFSQQKDEELTVALCDLGVGIPASLATKSWGQQLLDQLRTAIRIGPSDGELIKAAVNLNRTRTGQANRGNGLGDILNVIRKSGRGRLAILSAKGAYRYEGGVATETTMNYPESIMGTLVQWTIPLSAGEKSAPPQGTSND